MHDLLMSDDLFTYQGKKRRVKIAPLADRMRPNTLEEFEGQKGILADGRLLRRAISTDRVGNLILHGPPGVGKTTLARIVARHTRAHFSNLNAVLVGVKEVREEINAANQRLNHHGLRTILFIDEVHRFNSVQQDALLPWIENGTITLIGATTENPYFEVNKALLSRSRLFRLQSLESSDLHKLLKRAISDRERGYGKHDIIVSPEAADHLVDIANGDARSLLNALELAVESSEPDKNGFIQINLAIAEESIQERAVLYDKQGEAHYDTISAFIKSIRGSDPDASLFWLARMVEAGENPRFIFRRMLIAAGEDIGLADPEAIVVVEACAAAFDRIGLPEGIYSLVQAALYLASTEKSNSVIGFFEAIKAVRSANLQEVPSHLKDAHRDNTAYGDGIGYCYPHAYAEHWINQQYLPSSLKGEIFWQPSFFGWEGKRREKIEQRRIAQLAAATELIADQPLILSSGPTDQALETWILRQLGKEGERLNVLREKLWEGVSWKRNDRVLMIGARSLLWSLDPIKAVLEGGVTLLCDSKETGRRLEAQVEILKPELRPLILTDGLNNLPQNHEFEWIGGRIGSLDLQNLNWSSLLLSIKRCCHSKSKLRLLISSASAGPAGALLAQGKGDPKILEPLKQKEQQWLKQLEIPINFIKSQGWQIQHKTWEETINLPIDTGLEKRWFSEGSSYLKTIKRLSNESIKSLRNTLEYTSKEGLKLPMQHQLLIGNQK